MYIFLLGIVNHWYWYSPTHQKQMLKSVVMLNGPFDMTKAFGCVWGLGGGRGV